MHFIVYATHYVMVALINLCEKGQVLLFIIRTELNIGNAFDLSRKVNIIISRVISCTLSFSIFSISLTPATKLSTCSSY